MARRSGTKNELVKCEYCGEMYSVTYKQCPFCNGDGTGRWDDLDSREEYEERPSRGGKRLASSSSYGGGGGPSIGQVIKMVLSLALIIAAVCIVIYLVKPLLSKDKKPPESALPSAPAVASVQPTESAPAQPSEDPVPSQAAQVTAPPIPSQNPITTAPVTSAPPAGLVTPTDFKLNRDDFTLFAAGQLFKLKATYTPADARGDITWKSSDPNVASVAWDGTVTAVSQGTVTVTASVAGVGDRKCIVRCTFEDAASTAAPTQAPAASAAPTASTSLKLNREDFTLSRAGETWRMVVSGTSSAVTWTSSKPEVATIGADGTVTAVSKGTCKVYAEVDGVKLECIVRCSF